jgi:hypothetical protein
MKRYEGDIRVLQLHALQALAEYLKETELRINVKDFQRILEECLMRLSDDASTLAECLARYPEYTAQLSPLLETALLLDLAHDVKPSPTFNAYTRDALIQYVRSHPHQPQIIMPVFQRAALTFAVLVAALLVTGTTHAQSAMPGDTFYAWKRTSEQVWRAVSFNPVDTDIILAERRLNEWIAVANDPAHSTNARRGYLEALTKLKSPGDVETLTQIVPELRSQQQALDDAGLSSSELDDYLIGVVDIIPVDVVIPTEIVPTVAMMPTYVVPTEVPTEIVPTEIVSTEIVPTVIPTEIVPTVIPTEIVPTEIVPTEIPTEIAPTAETTIISEITPTADPQ